MSSLSITFSPAYGIAATKNTARKMMSDRFQAQASPQAKFGQETPLKAYISSPSMTRVDHFKEGLKNMLMIPVLPVIGYYAGDATGFSDFIGSQGDALHRVLGEGFGHAGLCFSLHYVLSAGWHFWKTVTGPSK